MIDWKVIPQPRWEVFGECMVCPETGMVMWAGDEMPESGKRWLADRHLRRAQSFAAAVRAKNPRMQVQRLEKS